MSPKKFVNLFLLLSTLLASFAFTGSALAWSGCNSPYTVQWGDTLATVAYRCGTTQDAIRQANPNIRYWLYAGQRYRCLDITANSNAYNSTMPLAITMRNNYAMDYNNTHIHLPRSMRPIIILPRREAEHMSSNGATHYEDCGPYGCKLNDLLQPTLKFGIPTGYSMGR